ncbi:MAG: phosphoadenosine phosphosulfate reductase family protein [Clostridiales bacterium]|jgi:3'-phosphoadenosine 5'-phosphosulfate sulfotransferase (PAPS reductase)/FAD synthetase|nr:phosphoadenosine phosphosulfate reductase family protein [Clostridiales bacterium]
MADFSALIESAPQRLNIVDAMLKARSVLGRHRKCAVSVSGGADSDTMLDLLELAKPDGCELAYVFFDTGLELAATKRHLGELEAKYGIAIRRRRAGKTVAAACREHGVPFISKDVSEYMGRLQAHGFDWGDAPENATEEKYGRCKSGLDWYFGRRPPSASGKDKHSISRLKLLKEFVQLSPPDFAISDRCCDFAKKNVARLFNREYGPDLSVNGMRQAEGGRRASKIKTCFSPARGGEPDNYRPIWRWTDEDRAAYKEWRGLRYSDCYEVYGLARTGCAGCPCNSRAERELAIVEPFEPQIAKAARAIFGASYEYRRRYAEFKAQGGASGAADGRGGASANGAPGEASPASEPSEAGKAGPAGKKHPKHFNYTGER